MRNNEFNVDDDILVHTTLCKVLAVMKCFKFGVFPHIENQFYIGGVRLDYREDPGWLLQARV